MLDLRNARAPEKILQGHECGVLSISWCQQDPELLLSCGKDNRAIVWNPDSGEMVGQLRPSSNQSFLSPRNPRNSDIFTTANYDSSIAMHSIQSTATTSTTSTAPKTPTNPNDVFDPANFANTANAQNLGSSVNLERALKWLKPPVGARFGFEGFLAEVTNTREEDKKRGQVRIKQVMGESGVVERAQELIKPEESDGGMKAFVESRARKDKEVEDAKDTCSTLLTLFDSDPKSALIKLTYQPLFRLRPRPHTSHSLVGEEPEGVQDEEGSQDTGTDVPSAAPVKSSTRRRAGGRRTWPAAGDFFNTLASDNDALPTRPRTALVPHLSYTGESSATTTIGSRTSSVAGDAPPTPSFPAKSFRHAS
ncbi:unnamed protein product [Rhizoctonia solani]|uniref:Protein transport protein SEC31 n=1 Tax=Rhizoctonia solani TaxID=456999 RepID=A0A8H3HQ37_9AGAM|nr:unnamed protein product [Rhizoctonia solani]